MPYVNSDPVAPVKANSRPATEDERLSWERQIVQDFNADTGLSPTPFAKQGGLYYLNDKSEMTLWTDYDNTANTTQQQVTAAKEGRLFLRDGDQLRQVQMQKDGDDFEISVSTPFKDLSTAVAPERPAFWKYLLYPFFSDEIQAYNQQKEIQPTLRSESSLESVELARGDHTRQLNKMEKKLNDMTAIKANVLNAAMKRDRSVESVTEAFMEKADTGVARQIITELRSHPERRTEILTNAVENLDTMLQERREFAKKILNMDDVKQIVEKGVGMGHKVQELDAKGELIHVEFDKYKEQGEAYFDKIKQEQGAKKNEEAPQKVEEAPQKVEEAPKKVEEDPQKAKLQAFEQKLIQDSAQYENLSDAANNSPNLSDIHLAMEDRAVSQFAKGILDKANEDPSKKDMVLTEAMKGYKEATNGIAQHISDMIENNPYVQKDIKAVQENGLRNDDGIKAMDRLEAKCDNAWKEYGKALIGGEEKGPADKTEQIKEITQNENKPKEFTLG